MKATLGFLMVTLALGSYSGFGQTLPVITASPTNTTVYPGNTAAFTVTATGATAYQWLFNGTNISGATSATLQVANAQSTNCGYYMVLVKNGTGWVPGQMAYLTLDYTRGGTQPTACGILPLSNTNDLYTWGDVEGVYSTSLSGPPTNGTVQIVAGLQLDEMQVVGTLVRYNANTNLARWFYNGYYAAPAQSMPAAAPGQTVLYSVVVSYTNTGTGYVEPANTMKLVAGTNGLATASNYGLQFPSYIEWPEPAFFPWYSSPTNLTRVTGETYSYTNTFWAYSLNNPPYGYPNIQWRKNGVPIAGATNYYAEMVTPPEGGQWASVLTWTNLNASDAGVYDLIVYGNEWVVSPKIMLSVQTTNGQGVFQSSKSVGTNLVCNLAGAVGRNYQVQWSTNLTSWNNLMSVSNATGTVAITNGVASQGNRFYRTVLLP
jgi:hypothetical protein